MKTVMIFGTFDILHTGHLDMFRQAREYGDRLVTVVSRDETTLDVKGNAPFHTHEERKLFLRELRSIDEVLSGNTEDVYQVIQEVRPHVIALGYDQKVFVDMLADKITEFGLETEIVRLSPYKPAERKSSKIKEYLEQCC
jgi:cytidyltransferase-like protein